MSGQLNFAMPEAVLATMIIAITQPFLLLTITRIPRITGRNTLQFLMSVALLIVIWAAVMTFVPVARPANFAEGIVSVMILAGAIIVFLEAWALLTTGYTLAILLALLKADRPLREEEISGRYRDGAGIQWVMNRRLSGLIHAGLVKRDGDRVKLTSVRGALVGYLYWASIAILGLRRTG